MAAPKLRVIGNVGRVPSFRVLAWRGWRNGPLNHAAAHRLHVDIGNVDGVQPDMLIQSICEFVREHRVLGASYHDVDGRPWLDMSAARLPKIDQFDLSDAKPGELDMRVQNCASEFANGSFELHDSLFRAALIRVGKSCFRVLASTHHLISDDVSLSLVASNLRKWLSRDVNHQPSQPAGTLDYGDYLYCMNEWFESDASSESRGYWKDFLSSSTDEFLRPLSGIDGLNQSAYADRVVFTIGGPILTKIDALARKLGTTRFTVLLAAQHSLIASMNDSERALVVAVTDGREHKSLRGTLGYMADKVIYRSKVDRSTTFGELVRSLHRQTAQSYPHRYLRYDRLLYELWPDLAGKFAPPMFNFRRQIGGVPRGVQLAAHPGLVVAKFPPSSLETHPARANFNLELIDRGELLVGKLAFSRQGCQDVLRMLNGIFLRVSPNGDERIFALTARE